MTPQILQRPPESHASQSQFCCFFLRPSFCPTVSNHAVSAVLPLRAQQLEEQQEAYQPRGGRKVLEVLTRTFWGVKTGKTLPMVCPRARYRWPRAVKVREAKEDEPYRGSTCSTAGAPLQVSPPGQGFLHVTFSLIAWKVSSLKKLVSSSWIKRQDYGMSLVILTILHGRCHAQKMTPARDKA